MRKLILIIIVALIGFNVGATPMNEGRGNGSVVKYGGDGDDLFPWPWGTECPFPWQEIAGRYTVKSVSGGPFNGHFLEITASKKDDSNIEFLTIREFNRRGQLYASGEGYAQSNERIVKGLLTTDEGGKTYTVMIRTYSKVTHTTCGGNSSQVTAITFCPLRGKKCMTDSNYVLERM